MRAIALPAWGVCSRPATATSARALRVLATATAVVLGLGGAAAAQTFDQARFSVVAQWQDAAPAPIAVELQQAFDPDFNLFWFMDRSDTAIKDALVAGGNAMNPAVTPDFGPQSQLRSNQTAIVPGIPPATGSPAVFGSIKSELTVDPMRHARLVSETTFVAEVFMDSLNGGSPPAQFDADFVPTLALNLTTIEPTDGGIYLDAAMNVRSPGDTAAPGPDYTWSVSRGDAIPGGGTTAGNLLDTSRFVFPTGNTSTFFDSNTAPPLTFTNLTQGQRLEFVVTLGSEVDNQGQALAQIDAFNTLDWSFATNTPGIRLVPVLTGSFVAGDYNGDAQVEQGDLDLVLLNWGQSSSPTPPGWNQQFPVGQIDQNELDGVLLNWGATAEPDTDGEPVPEPATAALLVGMLACACRRRR